MKQFTAPRAKKTSHAIALIAFAVGALTLNACSSGSSSTPAAGTETTVVAAVPAGVATTDAPTELAAVTPDTRPVADTDPSEVVNTTVAAEPSDPSVAKATGTTVKSSVKVAAAPPPTAARSNPDVDANAIPKLKNEVGALADVSVKLCVKAPNGWKSTGTVANNTKSVATYVITTAFLDAQGTTVGLGFAKVEKLNAGSVRDWAVSAQTTVGKGLQCIMRVTRGDA